MAVQAAVTRYKEEMIAGYERRVSDLVVATTREYMANGLTVTFLVTSSGGATAVTRGQNGLIPYNTPSNTQVSATLVEKHAPFALTGFDIFASQGSQTKVLQDSSWAVIRRDQDATILAELANATQDIVIGGGGTMDLATVMSALAALGVNNVELTQGEIFGLLTPGALGYLMQTTEFTSKDYVDVAPLTGGPGRKMLRWAGVNWIVSSAVSGIGTSAEILYIWHRGAIGYATNVGEARIYAGYDEQQAISWSRTEIYHVAKILQNAGIIKVTHNASAIGATT